MNNNQADLDYLKNLTILYVEDDDHIREQLSQFLRRRCSTLHLASNGQKGVELFIEHKPDVIVTDILMPVMDGLKMGRAIRDINPKVPIIITTAFEEPCYFHRAIDLGVDKYVAKPVDLDILEDALLKCTRIIRAEMGLIELQKRTNELQEAQHIAKLGYWRLDLLNDKLSWSNEFSHIFEIEAPLFSLNYLSFLQLIHSDDRERIETLYQAHLNEKIDYDTEYRLLLSNGEIKHIHERRQTDRNENEKPISTLGTIQDITERKLIEIELIQHRQHLEELVFIRTQELEKTKNEAECANRAKSVFLANMSHELRTPLNAILGFAQLIEHDPLLSDEHHKELQTINRAGQHLLGLINDVLEISRIEAGQSYSQNDLFDFYELLQVIEEIIRMRAEAKKLDFKIERLSELPHFVEGDSHHLRQVLINLLGNSVKYTNKGTVRLNITAEKKDSICFEVIDTGVGISKEDLQNIFGAFYQTENGISKGDGSGLGLTISKEFVRLMGGKIIVKSIEGRGSSFTFTIPLPEVDAPETAPKLKGAVISLAEGQKNYRVLVVEDNVDNRDLLTRILENVGFKVKAVENGKQAIEEFQIWSPDFIWMDMRMPVMDGYTATKKIRDLPNGQNVKIVALTASAFFEDRKSILSAGCDEVLTKPLREEDLFEIMRRLLALEFRYNLVPQKNNSTTIALNLNCLEFKLREELSCAAELLDIEAVQSIIQKIKVDFPEQARILEKAVGEFHFDYILHALRNS